MTDVAAPQPAGLANDAARSVPATALLERSAATRSSLHKSSALPLSVKGMLQNLFMGILALQSGVVPHAPGREGRVAVAEDDLI